MLFFQVIVPPRQVPEGVGGGGRIAPHSVEGYYVGMCVVPILVTGFYAYPFSETDVITSGFTLCCGWRRQLTNKDNANNGVSSQLRMISHDRQVWTFCCSNNILWGSPGWCAIRILPGCGLGALRKKN